MISSTPRRRFVRHFCLVTLALSGLLLTASPRVAARPNPKVRQISKASKVSKVQLHSIEVRGATRTYVATVLDHQGRFVPGVDLDLGALGADPDLRVATTPMAYSTADESYRATVTFPQNGDWVIVVRVHAPSQLVELFTEAITTAPATGDTHSSAGFSRAAVLRSDPTFFDRYNPTKGMGADNHAEQPASIAPTDSLHSEITTPSARFDPVALVAMLAHSAGAVAWLIAVVGLVVANRVGPGAARNQLIRFIASRYRLLAGGGLLVVVTTGLMNVDKNSIGIMHPRAAINTNLGIAYLALFGFKMALVVASIVTTYRIDQLLVQEPNGLDESRRKWPVGASASGTMLVAYDRVLRLAERNALLGGAILASVAGLSQIHHTFH